MVEDDDVISARGLAWAAVGEADRRQRSGTPLEATIASDTLGGYERASITVNAVEGPAAAITVDRGEIHSRLEETDPETSRGMVSEMIERLADDIGVAADPTVWDAAATAGRSTESRPRRHLI